MMRALPPPEQADREIDALIETLHQTGKRLEALTGGEMDSVLDRSGRLFLMSGVHEQLRVAETARQAAILSALPANIALLDAAGVIVSVNEAWRRFGPGNALHCPGHAVGIDYLGICDKARGDHAAEALAVAAGIRAVLTGDAKGYSLEYPCHSPEQQRWLLMMVAPLPGDPPRGAVVMHLDITERKRGEQELRQSESRFRSLTMLSSDWFWEQDDQHRFCRFSGGEGVEGWGPDQMKAVGLHRWDLGGVVPISCSWEEHKGMLDAHKPFRKFEYQRILGDGRLQYVEASGEPVFDAGGRFTGYRGVATEITERKLAEQNLLRFRAAMDCSGDAIVLVDRTSMRYVDVNQTLCELVGYTRQELIGMTPMALFGVEREVLERDYDAMIADTEGGTDIVEGSYRHRDGSLIPVETRRRAKRTNEGWIIVGSARDITERRRTDLELQRFRAAMDISADAIVLVDRKTMRYIDVNQTYCDSAGLTRQELIGLTPMEMIGEDRETMERDYDAIIADGNCAASQIEGKFRRSDGTIVQTETRRRALRTEDGWVVVSTVRNVTAEKEAATRITRLNRVYAVLSSINALIARVQNRDELFTGTCRIAVEKGGFRLAWIGIADRGAQRIVPAASAGTDERLLAHIRDLFSSTEGASHGNTLAARSMREKTVLFSNDSQNDPEVVYGHQHAESGVRSMAMLPLIVSGESVGVFALYSAEIGFFDDAEIKLLAGLAGDIAFAIEHIEGAGKLARTSRVNAMLSGINAAIVHHHESGALFREVCRIAVTDGGFTVARVVELDSNGKARIAASSESEMGIFQRVVDDRNNDAEHCQNLLSIGLRTGQVLVSNDVTNDARMPNRAELTRDGNYALALLPIIVEQRIAGTVILRSREPGMFDEAEMQLLREMVCNLSFALAYIEKETKVSRLTRVYSVLSGINSLIVRVHDRDELFKSACRIAVEDGKFTMAWIGTVDRGAMELVPVASAGTTQDPLALINQRFRLDVDAPPGNTISARAIREKKAAISNDVQNDPEVLFKEEHALRGSRSMAMLPLQIDEEVVGLLALYSSEVGFFDDKELTLLDELAGDIAFAMNHLDKQARIDYLAYYDVLTGLANRRLFLERVAQHMRSAAGNGQKLALFYVDLERFRNINDSLGRPAGDALLKQVADWLARGVGDAHLLGRMGEDHFAVVMPELKAEGNVAGLLEKNIRALFDHVFLVGDTELRISVKVGVALFPDDAADADALLRNAEIALKKAKARGDRYLFYRQKMNEAAAGKLTLENQLRQALDNEEFVLHYQPKVSLDTGRLTGAEALIRWNDPRTGLVPPGRFITVLEETGLIYNVGRWALRRAVGDFLRWRAAGLAQVRIAVNVSPLQLRHAGFIAEIEQVIAIEEDAAAGLELEITESLIMEDVRHSIASLTAIRAMGVTIAIDDFGTGFSSLSYLAKLPVDTLKIDRSFVIDMTAGPQGLALVSTIINLAHSMKLMVVAEGVETEEQSRLLRLLRCNEMQGFLFSKAVPAEIFEAKFLAPPAAG